MRGGSKDPERNQSLSKRKPRKNHLLHQENQQTTGKDYTMSRKEEEYLEARSRLESALSDVKNKGEAIGYDNDDIVSDVKDKLTDAGFDLEDFGGAD